MHSKNPDLATSLMTVKQARDLLALHASSLPSSISSHIQSMSIQQKDEFFKTLTLNQLNKLTNEFLGKHTSKTKLTPISRDCPPPEYFIVCGSNHPNVPHLSKHYTDSHTTTIISGKGGKSLLGFPLYKGTEAHSIRTIATDLPPTIEAQQFILDEEATNTGQNVIFSLSKIPGTARSIYITSPWAGQEFRSMMTLLYHLAKQERFSDDTMCAVLAFQSQFKPFSSEIIASDLELLNTLKYVLLEYGFMLPILPRMEIIANFFQRLYNDKSCSTSNESKQIYHFSPSTTLADALHQLEKHCKANSPSTGIESSPAKQVYNNHVLIQQCVADIIDSIEAKTKPDTRRSSASPQSVRNINSITLLSNMKHKDEDQDFHMTNTLKNHSP